MNPSHLSHLTGKPCKQHSCTIDKIKFFNSVVVGGVVVLMPVAGALNTGTSTMADADGRVPSAGEKERGIH